MSNDVDTSREVFMAAIVKLADDEAFRRSFLEHSELWRHPPVMAIGDVDGVCLTPGSLAYFTDEAMAALRPMYFLSAEQLVNRALAKVGGDTEETLGKIA